MNVEKVAFLYPYHLLPGSSERVPLLVLDAETLPFKADVHFEVYFLGLVPLQEYWVSLKLEKVDSPQNIELSKNIGAWIRAKAETESEKTLAASAALHFKNCLFEGEGDYLITATIHKDSAPLHSAIAYFSVSLIHEQ
ncbi:TPA: hypothetical protein ACOELP_001015 [Enterobacter hormaechei]